VHVRRGRKGAQPSRTPVNESGFRTGQTGTYSIVEYCTGTISLSANGAMIQLQAVVVDFGEGVRAIVASVHVPGFAQPPPAQQSVARPSRAPSSRQARVCGVTGRIAVETNMGAISTVMQCGSEAQKRLAARLVLDGDKPAICITEPDAGSVATEHDHPRRPAQRHLAAQRPQALDDWRRRLEAAPDLRRVFGESGQRRGIGGFPAVRDETHGLVIGKREPTMGLRGTPEREMRFENLEVPTTWSSSPGCTASPT
jgi:hypothetical protein